MTISSLFGTAGSAASAYGSITSANPTTRAILDAVAKATGATTGGTTGNGVTISTDAKLAAAEAADKSKELAALTGEVRQTLDKGDADLTEMSGRALATIILNRTSDFSRAEIAAAKQELNGRSRQDFTALAGNGALGGLGAYDQQLISQYDAMSPEEREARGWTSAMRDSAGAFVTATTQSGSSLFDLLNSTDTEEQ